MLGGEQRQADNQKRNPRNNRQNDPKQADDKANPPNHHPKQRTLVNQLPPAIIPGFGLILRRPHSHLPTPVLNETGRDDLRSTSEQKSFWRKITPHPDGMLYSAVAQQDKGSLRRCARRAGMKWDWMIAPHASFVVQPVKAQTQTRSVTLLPPRRPPPAETIRREGILSRPEAWDFPPP